MRIPLNSRLLCVFSIIFWGRVYTTIILPIFQTFIRWSIQKAIELFEFQLFGKAAISPISMNLIEKVDEAVNQVTFLSREPIDKISLHGRMSVNDGQQRLTCNYKAYTNHIDFQDILLDIVKGKFIYSKERKFGQIPVGVIYNKDDAVFQKYCMENEEFQAFDVIGLLTAVRTKFFSYYYTVNIAKDLSGEEQQEWFDVLNRAGSRVTDVEMDLVDLMGKAIDFYSEFSIPFFKKLEIAKFGNLFHQKSTEVTIPVACLNPAYEVLFDTGIHVKNFCPIASDRKPKLIAQIKDASDIRKLFKMTLTSLDEAIDFVKKHEMEIKSPDNIYYITYLMG
ncbi:MAG: hypothetical protein LBS21_09040, partial [Clostridiales bacterium]|nr:hypothetical protein [Clostridiales bacterium]